jgi:transglutaminase-like putative cysteine protease
MLRRRSVVGAAMALAAAAVAAAPADSPMRRRLRFSATLSNPGSSALRNQVIWLYMPVRETATQLLTQLVVSSAYEEASDSLGHCIVKFTLNELPGHAVKVVSIDAEVAVRHAPRQVQLANPAIWLGPEKFIEADDGDIRTLASQLKRESPMQTLSAIYDWVRLNISYAGYIADDLGAREALARRSGDCTEYACLAVALSRANGIPARMIGGYVASHDMAPRAEEYHNWAEVFVDGAWTVLDAQKECWGGAVENYVAFRIYREQATNPIGFAHRFKVDGDIKVRL